MAKTKPLPREKKYAAVSQVGYKPNNSEWINQDSCFVKEFQRENVHSTMAVVCDGHGINGHLISNFILEQLAAKLDKGEAIDEETFGEMQKSLVANENIDSSISGTTCTIVQVSNNHMTAMNCGDSPAFIGRRNEESQKLELLPITFDHVPMVSSEANRIKANGGIVNVRSGSNCSNSCGTTDTLPLRVWIRIEDGQTVKSIGLAMTRSLGDVKAHEKGVVSEPNVVKKELKKSDEFIMVCSDGVTDALECSEISELMDEYMSSLPPYEHKKDWDPVQAANMLVSNARRKWNPFAGIDDITCCIIKLH